MVFGKDKKIRAAFQKVRREFDEHLDAINANMAEIHENREMILELQERLCKLSDQITEVHLMIEESEPDGRFREDIDLSMREQEVFLSLYTAGDLLRYNDIARMLTLPVTLVQEIVEGMLAKGVPVRRQHNENGTTFLSLDPGFLEQQARENILGIDENLSKQMSRDFQMSLFDA